MEQPPQQPVAPSSRPPPPRWNRVYQALIHYSESKCGTVLKLILIILMIYFICHNFYSWLNRNRANHSWCVPNVTVSLDGKGEFTAISLAVEAAPANSSFKFCIYIRRGVYRENVFVSAEKMNLVFVGEGEGKTVITSSRSSNDDGFFSGDQIATLRILGEGFMARDLTIENAAGPEKNQGVALENWAYQTVFYHSSFLGYRDTVYISNGRQFYRDCHIQGTLYFISGDAQAVFQKCTIEAIELSPQEKIVISGQSRMNPTLKNGFVFHLCEFSTKGTQTSPQTFLGGPLQAYAVTVVMQSFLDASINPAGWLINNSMAPTVFYGEYNNRGPGALTRIDYSPVHFMDRSTAAQFTLRLLLEGKAWLPSAVPHQLDLV